MSIDLHLCAFCLHIWLLASAPQRGFNTGFALNASDNSQEILKESAQWGNLIPGQKLRYFFLFFPISSSPDGKLERNMLDL